MKAYLYFSFLLFTILSSCKSDKKDVVIPTPVIDSNTYRGDFHFSPPKGWMNDPNGLVYYDGEFHLFYQYNPDRTVWGPMHWGHAVSSDLTKWTHLPIALYPDSIGTIFSGSVVIDKENTAGFGKNAMVAIYTQHNHKGEDEKRIDFQNQSIAYSLDKGRTFTKYKANPVIKNPGIKDYRDPKVFWHKESNKWIMTLAAYDKVIFYNSPNLKDWNKTGEFGIPNDDRLWECPDLIELRDDNEGIYKWALIVSMQKKAPNGGTGTSYFIGNFDGKNFSADISKQKWLDYGKDNYAFVTFSNYPEEYPVGIGWMSNWQYAQKTPSIGWRSAMTYPRKLRLAHVFGDDFIESIPVSYLDEYLGGFEKMYKMVEVPSNSMTLDSNCQNKKYRLQIGYKNPTSGRGYLKISNDFNEQLLLGFDADKKQYFIDRSKAGITDFDENFGGIHYAPMLRDTERVDYDVILDNSSVEMFANGYRVVMTDNFYFRHPITRISLESEKEKLKYMKGFTLELKKF